MAAVSTETNLSIIPRQDRLYVASTVWPWWWWQVKLISRVGYLADICLFSLRRTKGDLWVLLPVLFHHKSREGIAPSDATGARVPLVSHLFYTLRPIASRHTHTCLAQEISPGAPAPIVYRKVLFVGCSLFTICETALLARGFEAKFWIRRVLEKQSGRTTEYINTVRKDC